MPDLLRLLLLLKAVPLPALLSLPLLVLDWTRCNTVVGLLYCCNMPVVMVLRGQVHVSLLFLLLLAAPPTGQQAHPTAQQQGQEQ
jgi:hypothetical protein